MKIYKHAQQKKKLVALKLNSLKNSIKGKRIVLIDDSNVREIIGADTLEYLSINNLKEISKVCKMEDFCMGCFTGKYQ